MATTQGFNMINGGLGLHPVAGLLPPPPPPPPAQLELLHNSLDEPVPKKSKPSPLDVPGNVSMILSPSAKHTPQTKRYWLGNIINAIYT